MKDLKELQLELKAQTLVEKFAAKVTKDKKESPLETAAVAAGLAAAPMGLAYLLTRRPQFAEKITRAGRRGVTFIQGQAGPGHFYRDAPVNFMPGFETRVIGREVKPPARPEHIPGLVVYQRPDQAKFYTGDVTVNQHKLVPEAENKLKEQRWLKKIGPQYATPTVDVTHVTHNRNLSETEKVYMLHDLMKKNKFDRVIFKRQIGASSGGNFVTEEDLKRYMLFHPRPKSLKKQAAALSELTDADEKFVMQKKLPVLKGSMGAPLEYRIHALDTDVIPSATHARWIGTETADPGGIRRRQAENHIREFLKNVHKNDPSLRKAPMQYAFDVGFHGETGKPIIFETNAGGLSGFLDMGRARADVARQMRGRRSFINVKKYGLPIGVALSSLYLLSREEPKKKSNG